MRPYARRRCRQRVAAQNHTPWTTALAAASGLVGRRCARDSDVVGGGTAKRAPPRPECEVARRRIGTSTGTHCRHAPVTAQFHIGSRRALSLRENSPTEAHGPRAWHLRYRWLAKALRLPLIPCMHARAIGQNKERLSTPSLSLSPTEGSGRVAKLTAYVGGSCGRILPCTTQ